MLNAIKTINIKKPTFTTSLFDNFLYKIADIWLISFFVSNNFGYIKAINPIYNPQIEANISLYGNSLIFFINSIKQ